MGEKTFKKMLWKILVILSFFVCGCFCGSCREAKLCCPGRDSSCVVQKAPINAIIEDLSDKPCYCDHACLKLGDCCSDFKSACGVIDCVVSPWGPWSDCDVGCGTGMTTRHREIQIQPQNGGKHCPSLMQKRGCQGIRCPHHVRNLLKETAMLLPIGLSWKRRINETADITRNLRMNYETKEPTKVVKKEYCVKFEVMKTSNACKKESNFTGLHDGLPLLKRFCTGCGFSRRILGLPPPCSNLPKASEPSCPHCMSVCVKCEEAAMREHRKEAPRCPGHGIEGRTTRWEALSAPHCRGKWIRIESQLTDSKSDDSAKCELCPQGSQFIFV